MKIKSSMQLKDLARNIKKTRNIKSDVIIRTYMMERFLERISLSEYQDKFILKGGILVASMVGLELRTTRDMDVTSQDCCLSMQDIEERIKKIIAVKADDNVKFELQSIKPCMTEMEHPGVNIVLISYLDNMRTYLNIDMSMGDVITPGAVLYKYKLLLEDREMFVWSYPIETILSEKLHAVFSKGLANSRMRDFYDIYTLTKLRRGDINTGTTALAYRATALHRKVKLEEIDFDRILAKMPGHQKMQTLWSDYQKNFPYASDICWGDAVASVRDLCCQIGLIIEDDLSL